MNVVKLKVTGSLPGTLQFQLARPGDADWAEYVTSTTHTLESLGDNPSNLRQLMPSALEGAIKQVFYSPLTGVLAILSEDSTLDDIPWEYLPELLQMPRVLVVRHLPLSSMPPGRPGQDPPVLLVAGWSGRPIFNLPGIHKELAALAHLGATTNVEVQVLSEPSLEEFADAYKSSQPLVLHIVPPSVSTDNGMPAIVISGEDDIQLVGVDAFSSLLTSYQRPRLVVINTCHCAEGNGGPSAVRMLSGHLGTAVIGWRGVVGDLQAVDFARFLYTRFAEGATVIDTLLAYRSLQPLKKTRINPEQVSRAAVPALTAAVYYGPSLVVWTPSPELLDEPPFERLREEEPVETYPPVRRTRRGGRRAHTPRERGESATPQEEATFPAVTIDFEPQKWLNPALLKNGRPPLFYLRLSPDRMLRNVGLAITCDTGSGMSTFRQTLDLATEQPALTLDAVQFPVLYKLIEDNTSRRLINFTVTCNLGRDLLAEVTTSAMWMDRTEWLDKPETWHYIPAFVQPFANKVAEVIGHANKILKQIDKATADFQGYQTGDSDFVMKQAKAVYNCLRGGPYEINYSAPPPILVYTDDPYASGQRVRTPDEVLELERGTCHDLAVLLASCLEQIALYPLIILIAGHTFVGFWKDESEHDKFWKAALGDIRRQQQDPGRTWTIRDLNELQGLVDKDAVALLEATMVADPMKEFEDALEQGRANLDPSDPYFRFDVAVDIQASRRFIQPL